MTESGTVGGDPGRHEASFLLLRLAAVEVSLIAITAGAIVATYLWALPKLFGGHKTYLPLCVGLVFVAATSAWLTRLVPDLSSSGRWALALVTSLLSSFLTLWISMGVIVNVAGC